jgi:hypothetical protein
VSNVFGDAHDIAGAAVEVFSKMHPHIMMNMGQWLDLKECIQREICATFDDTYTGSARDLLYEATQ